MKSYRALWLIFPLALLAPGVLAADVVYASRQFEIAPPIQSWPAGAWDDFYTATAVSAGSQGFVVASDWLYHPAPGECDCELEWGGSQGYGISPGGRLMEGFFDGDSVEGGSAVALARTGEGEVVAVWEAWDWLNATVGFRLMSLDGQLTQDTARQVSEYAENLYDVQPVVAANGHGLFVIAWTREISSQGVVTAQPLARVYGPNGTLSPELAVGEPMTLAASAFPPDGARTRAVGMDGEGNFVVLLDNLWGRRFDSTGQPLGEPFRIGTSSGAVRMAMRPSGDFVVAWQAPVQTGVLLLARFTPEGQRVESSPVRLRATDPALAIDSSGRVALSWIDRQNGRRRLALAVLGPALTLLGPVVYEPPASRDRSVNQTGVAFGDDGRILTVWVGPRSAKARDSLLGRMWRVR